MTIVVPGWFCWTLLALVGLPLALAVLVPVFRFFWGVGRDIWHGQDEESREFKAYSIVTLLGVVCWALTR